MNDVKGYLQSKTIWGLVLIVLSRGVAAAGWDIAPQEVEAIANFIAEAIGAALIIYGRGTATTPLAGMWQTAQSRADDKPQGRIG